MTHRYVRFQGWLARRRWSIFAYAVICGGFAAVGFSPAFAAEETQSSWRLRTADEIRSELAPWLESRRLETDAKQQLEKVWSAVSGSAQADDVPDRVLATIEIVDSAAAGWIRDCRNASWIELAELPLEILDEDSRPPIVRDVLRLFLIRALAWHQLYDEASAQLAKLDLETTVDPAGYLFYQAATAFRMRDKERAVQFLNKLMENESRLPDRFVSVARLMQADLKTYEEDTLDEVTRLMDSIRVRLGHGRAGKKVRDEEESVIRKLDKMIEDLEKQRQQMMASMGQGGGGNQSMQPAADSFLPGGGGQGDVDRKRPSGDTEWGDLPPKQREGALQSLGEDYPSHYREVIEEYFRTLAQESAEPANE